MAEAAKTVKNTKTAITPTREENFPEWYQQVVRAADMAENSPVRGCYTLKPYGFAVWENVQKHLGQMIKDEEVDNAYFPLLIPLTSIAKEAEKAGAEFVGGNKVQLLVNGDCDQTIERLKRSLKCCG